MPTTLTPITASIPDFTVTPQINTATFPEDIDQYNSELPAVITEQDLLATEINTLIPQLNTLEDNVASLEASTQSAADIALAVSNFKGTWSGQLTSISPPESWLYNGVVYMVLVAGTASPVTSPANWFAIGTASSTTFAPSGNIIATNVQSAIEELDTEKAPKSAPSFTGGVTIAGGLNLESAIIFEGTTSDAFETTLTVAEPTADRDIQFPDESGTVAFLDSPEFTGTPTAPSFSYKPTPVTITSWSYVTTTITLNVASHTFVAGDYIEVGGLTATTNIPNGVHLVTSVTATTIVFTYALTPTGAAGVSSATVKGYMTTNGRVEGIGVGQTWRVLTGSRISGDIYTNTTGNTIMVAVYSTDDLTAALTFRVNGEIILKSRVSSTGTSGAGGMMSVPNHATYSVTAEAGYSTTIEKWSELR